MPVWGSAVLSGTNGFRVGGDLVWDGSVVRFDARGGTQYPIQDSNNAWSVGGSFSGSGSVPINTGSRSAWSWDNVFHIGSWRLTPRRVYGSTVRVTATVALTGIDRIPGTASATLAVDVPALPYLLPRRPPALAAARTSDTSHKLTWTRDADSASGPSPVSNYRIMRRTDGGALYTVATVSGSVATWTDGGTAPDRSYQWTVGGLNQAGAGPVRESGVVYTTPAVPSILSVERDGDDVLVRVRDNSRHGASIELWDYPDGAPGGVLVATVGPGVGVVRHSAPALSATHQYSVRARRPSGLGQTLYSAHSAKSGQVALLAPPLAPTNVGVAGQETAGLGIVDAALPLAVVLQHNPVDSSPLVSADVDYRVVGAAGWTDLHEGPLPGGRLEVDPASSPFVNGTEYEVRARTWGGHATASPFASARFRASWTPVMEWSAPSTVDTNVLDSPWLFSEAGGAIQAGAEAVLLDGASGSELERRVLTGQGSSIRWDAVLQNGRTYRLEGRVRDADGQWSALAEHVFAVEYAVPLAPTAGAEFDVATGTVGVQVAATAPASGEPEAVEARIEWTAGPVAEAYEAALADGASVGVLADVLAGARWEVVAEGVAPSGEVTDPLPVLGGVNVYRVYSVSALPSVSEPVVVVVDTRSPLVHQGVCWIVGGPGWASRARFRGNAEVSGGDSREVDLVHFEGREEPDGRVLPVAFEGLADSASYDVKFKLDEDASPLGVIRAVVRSGPVCFRDVTGVRVFGIVPGVSWSRARVSGSASFKVEEVAGGRWG